MTGYRKPDKWLVVLVALHAVIACGGFFAPYGPVEQDREHAYASPMRLHLVDRQGKIHLRPFFYPLRPSENSVGQYDEDMGRPISLRFFASGASYKLLGFLPSRLHLFRADGARIYLLGSDGYGRDQLSRILYGGQVSLLAGLLGAGITLFIGLGVGAVAGYYGGWRDDVLMRLAELFLALPWLYLLFALRAFLPLAVNPLEAFLLIVVVIATVGWARPARLVRGVVLSAKERDFVRAARGFGASDSYLFRRHVLPETSSVLLTQAAILIPQYVLAEMTLSFLGLGVPEPVASWGNLLTNLQQYSVLMSYWWMYLPALAVAPFFVGYLGLAAALEERADSRKMGSWGQEGIG
ncbi:MAG TPA: ABC transporter permease [Candidatus Sulfotelmatobacter sp.]|jgi:peptide/nickel transport system permease protein|nr:ABC transporter permease [Candidatus Sulfotelmatobacter sp.]